MSLYRYLVKVGFPSLAKLLKPDKQKTFCYCDCGNELCSSNSFVSDDIYVQYSCSECGEPSTWDFDTPVPIRTNP